MQETTLFCGECDQGVTPLGAAGCCPGCALPGDPAAGRCAGCRGRTWPFARAGAALLYGEAVARAIVRMKHAGRKDLARPLGRALGPELAAAAAGVDAILPVPLYPRKLRARGFNQALALALAARRAALVPGAPIPPVERATLLRIRDTAELGHRGPAERRQELAGAFAVAPRAIAAVRGRSFLLVDDVMTTGATLVACTEALLAEGARSVGVLALARAPG